MKAKIEHKRKRQTWSTKCSSRRDVDHQARTVKTEQLHQKEGARKPPARRESESALRAIACLKGQYQPTERSSKNSSIWQESVTRNLSWLYVSRGENLERRYSDTRSGRFGKVGCIRCSSSKNQRERSIDQKKQMTKSCSQ